MGSYCSLRFDDIEVSSNKSFVPEEFGILFQEGDRRTRPCPDDEGREEVFYEANREVMLGRLDLLGCSREIVRDRFATWRDELLEQALEDDESEAKILTALDYGQWQLRVPRALKCRYQDNALGDELDRLMKGSLGESGWLWFAGECSLLSIRALLEACLDVKNVSLDISDLVWGGYIDPSDRACAAVRTSNEMLPLAPAVILAEGSTDITILKRSLCVLFPEYTEYFSFFDHTELRVDGGADYLVKFLKAFAAAKIPFRLVAVFDNDTVGVQSYNLARSLNLPPTMPVIRLPDTELARHYPTIGPQGSHSVDVNGSAASLELYLGRQALSDSCGLRPVRWTSYVNGAGYQGVVEGKGDVLAAFLAQIKTHANPISARAAHPELEAVWLRVFEAARTASEHTQRTFSKSLVGAYL